MTNTQHTERDPLVLHSENDDSAAKLTRRISHCRIKSKGSHQMSNHYFGDEPAHAIVKEEKANIFSKMTYWWISSFIRKAAVGDLQTGVTMEVSKEDTAHLLGVKVFQSFDKQRCNARRWDHLIDNEGVTVCLKGDRRSQGIVRWIGTLQQAPDPQQLMIGVEWADLPEKYHKREHASKLTNGVVDGERLFLADSNRGSVEVASDIVPNAHCPTPPKAPSIYRALLTIAGPMWTSVVHRLLYEALFLGQPMLLKYFIAYLNGSYTVQAGATMAAGFFVLNVVSSVVYQKYFHQCMRCGLQMRSALMAMIYHKAATISHKAGSHPDLSVGRIVTLMSADVERVNVLCGFIHYIWSAPLQIVVIVAMLYQMIGWIAFASVGLTLLLMPPQAIVMKRQYRAQAQLSTATDKRVKATNELFSAIRVVKYMGWEKNFQKSITALRDTELCLIKRVQTYSVLNSFLAASIPMVITMSVFVLYHSTGHVLTADVVFPVMAFLQILQLPFMVVPMMFGMIVSTAVSVKRLHRFLDADDVTAAVEEVGACDSSGTDDEAAAVFKGACFAAFTPHTIEYRRPSAPRCLPCLPKKKPDPSATFYELRPTLLLKNVTIRIPKGKFTVVVGATGSGKSTLLDSMLNDLEVVEGEVKAARCIAYVPQQPWIMNGTVLDNVVFFDDFDRTRFDAAVKACQLAVDMTQFSNGEATEIGERGVNLSGGQKARIALARSVYANKQLYLLDDPLSAVDAHVGEKLVSECFIRALAGKTRVLATHQVHVIEKADYVIALKDGEVVFSGSSAEYRQVEEVVEEDVEKNASEGKNDEEKKDQEADATKKASGGDQLTTTEERAQGSVPLSMYARYFRYGGGNLWILIVLLVYIITECANAASTVWLSIWSSKKYGLPQTTYLYVYVGIIGANAVSSAIRALLIYSSGRRATRELHKQLLVSVSVAHTSFFDTTPQGRIINRFSKDVDSCDNTLPGNFLQLFNNFSGLVSTLAIMVASQWYVIAAIVPIAAVYYKVMTFFNAANREIKRVDSINKSPVFALLSEMLDGAKNIVAYGKVKEVIREALKRIDSTFSSAYLQLVANRWLGLRLEIMGAVVIASLAAAGVITRVFSTESGDTSLIALGLTLSLTLTGKLNWLVRGTAAVEAGMNSVERIIYYVDDLDHEDFSWYNGTTRCNPLPSVPIAGALAAMKGTKPPNASSGKVMPAPGSSVTDVTQLSIQFNDVALRYRPGLPLVLDGVNFEIKPRQKVGIIGRTGSGKSTTLLAFLRIVDVVGGEILIGGKSSKDFALWHLRSLFSMIPQDPILFTGTIRSNLDPFNENSEAAIMNAIESVGMKERILGDGGIDAPVSEAGKNFSVGQRQLLCMARALLKRDSAFILMDEATANIDPESDALIQNTVRTAFKSRTVITIAHRLKTIMDSNMLIVMDKGKVAELGSPAELATQRDGVLHSMIKTHSADAATDLFAMAEKSSGHVDE